MRIINYIFFILMLMVLSKPMQAQHRSLLIKVMDSKNLPVPYASVKMKLVSDSGVVFSFISDSIGLAKVASAKSGNYRINVTAVGYKNYTKDFLLNEQSSFSIKLTEDATQLKEVVVTSSKPLIRQEDDKSVVDPEPLAASSTNAFETIEKTPGIFIDQDGQVYLNGLSPASVQINGRDLKMSASDIATLLKSLPPNAIQKIELIRTPSAKYDASGGGGVVNIVLAKGVKIGVNGSVNTGFNQGRYGNQFIGFNLSNNTDKLSSYINAQYSHNDGYSLTNTDRNIGLDTILKQNANTLSPNTAINMGYGLSKNVKEVWEFNYDGRASQNNSNNSTTNVSSINIISLQKELSNIRSLVNNKGTSNFLNQSFRVKRKLDSLGGEWINDFSMNFSNSSTDQFYQNTNTLNQMSSSGNGEFGNDRNYYMYQSDYKKKWGGVNVETGIKTSLLVFDNHANYTKTLAGAVSNDVFRTSRFHYEEQINAGYVQGAKTWGKVILKLGSRLEQTIMQGHQKVPQDTNFSVNRTDAFPYIYLSRQVATIASYELRAFLVYRKTITRPSYDQLNPFAKYVDPFLYETGNPGLRPQFTTNYEANLSVDDKPLFAYGVNETKDIFTNVVYQSTTNKQMSYRTFDNLGSSRETYFRIVGVIPPGKKYFAVVGTQFNKNEYSGFYEGKPITFDRGTWAIFSFQSYKLDANSVITLNGFWRIKGQQQFYALDDFGSINMSVNRQFIKKKLTITASFNDLFFTNNNHFVLQQGSVNATGYRENDTKRWGLSLRYNFGFKPKEKKFEMLDNDPTDR
jgi:hypothetical protein